MQGFGAADGPNRTIASSLVFGDWRPALEISRTLFLSSADLLTTPRNWEALLNPLRPNDLDLTHG